MRAFRILAPFSINDEKVTVRPRGKVKRRCPESVAARFHRNGALLPFCKITNEQNSLRIWVDQAKCLFLQRFCCFSHNSSFLFQAPEGQQCSQDYFPPLRRRGGAFRLSDSVDHAIANRGWMSKQTYSLAIHNTHISTRNNRLSEPTNLGASAVAKLTHLGHTGTHSGLSSGCAPTCRRIGSFRRVADGNARIIPVVGFSVGIFGLT
jgi:hypothetical protein